LRLAGGTCYYLSVYLVIPSRLAPGMPLMPLKAVAIAAIGRALSMHSQSHFWKMVFSEAGMRLDATRGISAYQLAVELGPAAALARHLQQP
jgi:hypothetical protein